MMPDAAIIPSRCIVLVCAVAAQRLFELWLSRRNLARAALRSSSTIGERHAAGTNADWSAMIGVHTALITLPALEAAWFGARASDLQFATAVAAYAAAQALRYWSIASLGSSWNARAVVDSRQDCVARGPYRWIRHPNYLAVIVDFSAVPLALGAWRSWIVLNVAHAPILIRRIRAEEKLLSSIPGYAACMSSKGRFVPRWRDLRARAT
jgi:methyltransferase